MSLWSKAIFQPCHRHVLHPIRLFTGEWFFKCHYDSICRLMHQIFYTTMKEPQQLFPRNQKSSLQEKTSSGKGPQRRANEETSMSTGGWSIFKFKKFVKKRPGQFYELVSTWPRHHLFGVWRKFLVGVSEKHFRKSFFSLLFSFLDNFVSFVLGQNA